MLSVAFYAACDQGLGWTTRRGQVMFIAVEGICLKVLSTMIIILVYYFRMIHRCLLNPCSLLIF